MADKTAKRKAFDIPILDDVDEVVQITPVFTRRTKTRNPQECKTSVSKAGSSKTTENLSAELSDKTERIPAPSLSEKPLATSIETVQSETRAGRESSKSESSEKTGGKKFLETFAFIENTKYYEAAQSTASTSKNYKSSEDTETL